MKKQISKLISLALSLALTLSLALPALAYEDTNPPQWEEYGFSSLEGMLDVWDISEEEYYDLFVADALAYQQYQEKAEARRRDWIAAHPDEAAAFDPDDYFFQNYSYFESPQEYMEWYELTEEEFRREMLDLWVDRQIYQLELLEVQTRDKVSAGGTADGINVMVNGQCIPFSDVRPEIKNGRTMVPLASAMEYLGASVSYDRIGHTASVTLGDRSFTHAIGTALLTPADGEAVTMDVASYVKDGSTMVPVSFFAQALGYEVFWDSAYETAVLLDRQAAVEAIDQNFTLANRILYTMTGADQYREGQSLKSTLDMDLVITMLDSLNGDKKYSAHLDGDSLTSGTSGNIKYTANLGQLVDLFLDIMPGYSLTEEEKTEVAGYKKLLSSVSVEIILDGEGQCLYLRSPLFAQMGMVENPRVWAALPLEGLADAAGMAPDAFTVGGLITTLAFADPYRPFDVWSDTLSTAGHAALVIGDSCFTKSGSSYTIRWDMEDAGYYVGFYEKCAASAVLTVTPSGAKGCTYSLTAQASSSYFSFDCKLAGSSGKTDLAINLHVKNLVKAALEMTARITATRQQPQTQPPAGDKIEYPAGRLGMGSL